MRTLVFSSPWPGLTLDSVHEAFSAGWQGPSQAGESGHSAGQSSPDTTFCPLPLHGSGLVSAAAALPDAGVEQNLRLADGTSCTWRFVPSALPGWPDGYVVFDAADLISGMSTWKVGAVYRELVKRCDAGVPVVAYVPSATVSDGGAGFLAAVAGAEPPTNPASAAEGELCRWWETFVHHSRFGIIFDLEEPYLRPGIDALRGEPAEAGAQRAERERMVHALAAAGVDVNPLLGQSSAGCGGGLGLLALASAGAQAAHTVTKTLVESVPWQGTDLAVIAVPVADWRMLRDSVVTAVADQASEHVVPVVVLAGAVDVGRRELSSIGVSSAYACRDDALAVGGLLAVEVDKSDITERARAIARTWCRHNA